MPKKPLKFYFLQKAISVRFLANPRPEYRLARKIEVGSGLEIILGPSDQKIISPRIGSKQRGPQQERVAEPVPFRCIFLSLKFVKNELWGCSSASRTCSLEV